MAHRGGVGENGNRPALMAPRVGRLLPLRYSTSTMTSSGMNRSPPGNGVPPDDGNHECWISRYLTRPNCMPSANAATAVRPNEVKLPTSAAVSAGTMSAGSTAGSIDFWMVAAKMPSRPVMSVEMTQLAPARNSGEKPSTTAPFSFSLAARVARPKRVIWNTTHSSTVKMTTSTAMVSASAPMLMPNGNFTGLASLSKNGIGFTV